MPFTVGALDDIIERAADDILYTDEHIVAPPPRNLFP